MSKLSNFLTRQSAVRIAVAILLVALVAPFVVYAVPQSIGADQSYVVLTDSMSPAIDSGDIVIVDETNPEAIAEGDVITFVRSADDPPVTHRVVEVSVADGEREFLTQGDANADPDSGTVPAENVIGSVALVIPMLGYVIQFINTPAGFTTFVIAPIVLLIATEAWSLLGPTLNARRTDSESEVNE